MDTFQYFLEDIIIILCSFLSDFDKCYFLSCCKNFHEKKQIIRFNETIDIKKICTLSYFNSFINIILENIILTEDIFVFPRYVKKLKCINCSGNFIFPQTLISLSWSSDHKLHEKNLPTSLKILEIKNQKNHAQTIVQHTKNLQSLIIQSKNKISFEKYYPATVTRLEWNCDKSFVLNKNWNILYLKINSRGIWTNTCSSLKILEFGPRCSFTIRWNNEPNKNLKKLIIDSNRVKFIDCNKKIICNNNSDDSKSSDSKSSDSDEKQRYTLPSQCSIKKLVFGKHFKKSITGIIPPSVIKCTFHGGKYKGILPSTVKKIIIIND